MQISPGNFVYMESYNSTKNIGYKFSMEMFLQGELKQKLFSNYVEWLTIAYAITLTGHPALSIPAGFTMSGLPVGLQMVGGPRGEENLLMAAELYEKASTIKFGVPIDPITS